MWKTNCFLLTNIQLQTAVPFQTVIGEAEHTLWKRTLLLCSGDYGPWKHGYFTPDSDYTPLLPSTGDNSCTVCPWNLWWGQVMDCEHWDGVYSGLCSYVGVVCMCVCVYVCVCRGRGGKDSQHYNPCRLASDASTLCFSSVCMHWLGQRSFYAVSSVWNSLPFKDHQAHSHLSNHL